MPRKRTRKKMNKGKHNLQENQPPSDQGKTDLSTKNLKISMSQKNLGIREGDRVAKFGDNGRPYAGTVKWVGRLAHYDECVAGVEFDHIVSGGGTGLYKDKKIFSAKVGHGEFVPINALILEGDLQKQPITSLKYDSFDHRYMNQQLSMLKTDYRCLHVGCKVTVKSSKISIQGVLRWIGHVRERVEVIIGLESDKADNAFTHGIFLDKKLFSCAKNKALFVQAQACSLVREAEKGDLSINLPDDKNIENYFGYMRGIQGWTNSCYLDATLFTMFATTDCFDNLFNQKLNEKKHSEIQSVLKNIVENLRGKKFVSCKDIMELREKLQSCDDSQSGLTTREKDPEELLGILLKVLEVDPWLKWSCGDSSYLFQLIVDPEAKLEHTDSQTLFDLTVIKQGIGLRDIPHALIIQLPRFGTEFKPYKSCKPTMKLNLSTIMDSHAKHCHVCHYPSTSNCLECYLETRDKPQPAIWFCDECVGKYHKRSDRANHVIQKRMNSKISSKSKTEEFLELVGVICIKTSHYVSFVRAQQGSKDHWLFFDSMSDRIGDQNGFNVPCVLNMAGLGDVLNETHLDLDNQHEHTKRLLTDSYLLIYQHPQLSMYN